MSDKIFDFLKNIFNEHQFRLYMIGSTSRDYLLNKKIRDYDFVTDATPKEIKLFLNVEETFSKYGVVNYKVDGCKIDIVTLRKESQYVDSRHPSKIEFVKDINLDYVRRDFTINAIYIDEKYEIIDPSKGLEDLNNRLLRMIGDPFVRIKEDPLRILRAERFKYEYNLEIDEKLQLAIDENYHLLDKLNPDKVKQELTKLERIKEGMEGKVND